MEKVFCLNFGPPNRWKMGKNAVQPRSASITRDKLTVRDLLRHGGTDICDRYIHGIVSRLIEAQNRLVIAIGLGPRPPKRVRMSHHDAERLLAKANNKPRWVSRGFIFGRIVCSNVPGSYLNDSR